ncbi:hypothetical protein KDA23_07700, partial [Candidatus Saccharibacteria bacterium]|nr:hypothetical protein [Candidatus Saccharibacteria bacterium]
MSKQLPVVQIRCTESNITLRLRRLGTEHVVCGKFEQLTRISILDKDEHRYPGGCPDQKLLDGAAEQAGCHAVRLVKSDPIKQEITVCFAESTGRLGFGFFLVCL